MTEENADWFDPSPFIEDSHKLIDIVGEWPSFDDAEILSLVLDRRDGSPWIPGSDSPTLDLRIRLAETGYFLTEIRFNNVLNFEMAEFRYQNSVQEIVFESIPDRVDSQGNHTRARISIEILPHCGLKGKFEFQSAVVLFVVPCDRNGRATASSESSSPPLTG